MRRFTLTIATSITALALLPAGALASGHSEQHKRHERRHHRAHHALVRHERFGSATSAASTTGSGSSSGTIGTPTPSENAGTVKSFDAGVLTLALSNGSTVSGTVTNGTEIECEMREMDNLRADGDGGRGDNGDRGNDNGGPGDENGGRGDDNGDRGDNNGDRGDDNNCMASDLVAGAVVRSAELRISSAGATWDKVELNG